MRPALLLLLLALSPALAAENRIVDFDRQVDFSTIRTFTLRGTAVRINDPGISNSLVIGRTTDAIRAALVSRGLSETTHNADVIVDWTVSGQAYALGAGGRAWPVDDARGGGWNPGTRQGGHPVAFIDGLMVIDLTAPSSGLLIWRGVSRDTRKDAAKLAAKLPDYAKKLLAGYPSGKK